MYHGGYRVSTKSIDSGEFFPHVHVTIKLNGLSGLFSCPIIMYKERNVTCTVADISAIYIYSCVENYFCAGMTVTLKFAISGFHICQLLLRYVTVEST